MPNLNISALSALASTQLLSSTGGTAGTTSRDFGQELQRATQANSSPTPSEPAPAPAASQTPREPVREPAREGDRAARDDDAQAASEDDPASPTSSTPHTASEAAPAGKKAPAPRTTAAGDSGKAQAKAGPGLDAGQQDVDGLTAASTAGLADSAQAGLDTTTDTAATLADTGPVSAAPTGWPNLALQTGESVGTAAAAAAAAGADPLSASAAAATSAPGAAASEALEASRTAARAAGAREPLPMSSDAAKAQAGAPTDFAAVQSAAQATLQEADPAAAADLNAQPVNLSQPAPTATTAWLAEQRSHAALASATPSTGRSVGEPLVANIDAAIGSAGFAPALGTRISVLARDGIEHARLNVHPAELGPIALRLAMDGTQVRVDMSAEWGATRQALEQSLPALAAALRDAGFTLAGGGVFQQAPQDRGAQQGQPSAASGKLNPLTESDALGPLGRDGAQITQRPRGLVDLIA